jgi:hypothetical protein
MNFYFYFYFYFYLFLFFVLVALQHPRPYGGAVVDDGFSMGAGVLQHDRATSHCRGRGD